MSYFKEAQRSYNFNRTVSDLVDSSEFLEGERLVNRVLYGTDYDPSDIAYTFKPLKASFSNQKIKKNQIQKTIDEVILEGHGFIDYKIDQNGRLSLPDSLVQECLTY